MVLMVSPFVLSFIVGNGSDFDLGISNDTDVIACLTCILYRK